jgi:aspartyl-tRNA(Asn)/glutamyl-tRNA(Gln) amidotransferase subunit C
MPQKIDTATVRHIGHLARLRLTEAEVERYAAQLSDILEYADQLKRLDTTGVAPTAHPLPVRNVFRADEPVAPLGAERVLANAPRTVAGQFALPKVLDQEGA